MTVTEALFDVDLRSAPALPARHQFHEQIARLERELTAALAELDLSHRPPQPSGGAVQAPRLLTSDELEATRDALFARLSEVRDLVARQASDHADARSLLRRMDESPAEFRWTSVTTKDLGVEGCRTWQSVPVMGPVGMLGDWWRIRMSSGCP